MAAIDSKNISLLFQLFKFAALTGQSRGRFAVLTHEFNTVHAPVIFAFSVSVGRLGTLRSLRNLFEQLIYFVNRNMLKND